MSSLYRVTRAMKFAALLCAALAAGCKDKKAEPDKSAATPGATAPSASGVATATKPAPAQGSAAPAAATTPTADAGADAATVAGSAAASAAVNLKDAAAYADPSAADRQPESIFEKTVEPNLADGDPRRKRLEAALTEELSMPAAVLLPIEVANEVYAIYQYSQHDSCAAGKDKRPSTCPPADELALNPECHGYGLVRATFEGDKKPPAIVHSALESIGCDLKVRHWFVADRGDARKDVVLEIVTSYVIEREPGEEGAPPRDSIHRQQFLTLWTPSIEASIGWFAQELAEWTAEPGRTAEPPVLDAFLLHGIGPGPQLAVVHLLPCYDPTSAAACATELRKRKVYRYGLSY